MWRKLCLSLAVVGLGLSVTINAQVDPDAAEREPVRYSPNVTFTGDRYRIGVGVDTEFDFIGEFQASFHEGPGSAFIGEGWLGRKGAGGAKINYHWVFGGETAEGLDGPVYTSGRIGKVFLAADQNQHDDRKLTFGGGYEHQDTFFSLYGMRAISSERLVNRAVDIEDILVEGQIDGRDFTRIDQLQRITDWFEAPYEWGVGARVGRHFDGALIRIRGGLDYEDGKFGTRQTTVSFSIDKFFSETPHSLSLRTGYARKKGEFETDRNDWRASLVYSYSFGQTYRPQRQYREETVTVQTGDPTRRYEERLVATEVTLSDEATFAFDRSELRPAARAVLDDLIAAINEGGLSSRIQVVGHTCDIGTEAYNQGLSERRARSVTDYLRANGIGADDVVWEGRGELAPRYPNDSEENRSRNRRVEISFVTERETMESIAVGPDEPVTEIRQVEIPVEAAWIRRALRNPVRHKRIVDYYRYQETSETLTEGTPVFDNQPPAANDDVFTVDEDSVDNVLDVLANDTDPDGDSLSIVDTTQPANGQVQVSGNVVLYTPNPGFTGTDTFSYTVEDGFGGSDGAMVTVNVMPENLPPAAPDLSVSTDRTVPVEIDLLAEASDPDGDPLEVINLGSPSDGTLEMLGNGRVRYTPDVPFVGGDSFTYTVSDGRGGEDTGTVSIDVMFANRPPVAIPDRATTPAGVPVTVEVLANDFDPDGDPLEVIDVRRVSTAFAEAVINDDNTITFVIGATCSGVNIFNYTITDPYGATASTNVVIERVAAAGESGPLTDENGSVCNPDGLD